MTEDDVIAKDSISLYHAELIKSLAGSVIVSAEWALGDVPLTFKLADGRVIEIDHCGTGESYLLIRER